MAKVNPEAELAVKLSKIGSERNAAEDAAKLCSIARALHRLDELECNRELTAHEDMRAKRLIAEAQAIITESYGLKMEHNGDPRGYAIYIHFPDGSSNSWGGSQRGWGI